MLAVFTGSFPLTLGLFLMMASRASVFLLVLPTCFSSLSFLSFTHTHGPSLPQVGQLSTVNGHPSPLPSSLSSDGNKYCALLLHMFFSITQHLISICLAQLTDASQKERIRFIHRTMTLGHCSTLINWALFLFLIVAFCSIFRFFDHLRVLWS